uniref:Uncharacterized protein n=1 Tax=Arundo donax TaxID=35708 RepID=A0A0A9FKI5_ARUDO
MFVIVLLGTQTWPLMIMTFWLNHGYESCNDNCCINNDIVTIHCFKLNVPNYYVKFYFVFMAMLLDDA